MRLINLYMRVIGTLLSRAQCLNEISISPRRLAGAKQSGSGRVCQKQTDTRHRIRNIGIPPTAHHRAVIMHSGYSFKQNRAYAWPQAPWHDVVNSNTTIIGRHLEFIERARAHFLRKPDRQNYGSGA